MSFENDQDNRMHKAGWLVLSPGEAYEHRFTLGASVFLFKEEKGWVLWRAYWSPGEPIPRSEKELAVLSNFEQAFQRAQSYVEWRKGRRRGAS